MAGTRATTRNRFWKADFMTVYPLVISIGPLVITGFGLMMMMGFLVGGWVIQKELLRRTMSGVYAEHMVVAAIVGGILGAKLWYVAISGDPGALFSRSGLERYGGFFGGFTAVLLNGWRKHVPARLTLEFATPALAVAHAVGRVGCFLIQDDYGVPTSLPWGMKFPEGSPPTTPFYLRQFGVDIPQDIPATDVLAVHPTQLYEIAALMFLFWILWRLRTHDHAVGWLFGLYMVGVGIERFLVEFIRAKDDRVFGMFTVAQVTSIVILLVGVILVQWWWRRDDLAIPSEATILTPEPVPTD